MPGLQPAPVFRGLPPQLGLSSDPLPPPRAPHSSSDAPCFWTSVHRFLRPHILCLFTWLRLVPPSCLSCKATSLRKPPLIPDKVRALCYLPRYVTYLLQLFAHVFTYLFIMSGLAKDPCSIVSSRRGPVLDSH